MMSAVFFGSFVALLRIFAGPMAAGITKMPYS
jgi:membrane protein DedA with SNARE-associated domain